MNLQEEQKLDDISESLNSSEGSSQDLSLGETNNQNKSDKKDNQQKAVQHQKTYNQRRVPGKVNSQIFNIKEDFQFQKTQYESKKTSFKLSVDDVTQALKNQKFRSIQVSEEKSDGLLKEQTFKFKNSNHEQSKYLSYDKNEQKSPDKISVTKKQSVQIQENEENKKSVNVLNLKHLNLSNLEKTMLKDLQERIQQYMKEEQQLNSLKKDEKNDITPITKQTKKQLIKNQLSIISNTQSNDQQIEIQNQDEIEKYDSFQNQEQSHLFLKSKILQLLDLSKNNKIQKDRNYILNQIKLKFGDYYSEDQYENIIEFLQKSYRNEDLQNDKLFIIKNKLLSNLIRILPENKNLNKLQTQIIEQIVGLNQMYKQKEIQNNFQNILQNVQKQGALAQLQGLTNKSYFQKKIILIKKMNELVDLRKQKELKLQSLYNQLQENVQLNFEEQISQLKIQDKIKNDQKLWSSSIQNSMSKMKKQEILIDETISQQNFDFSNYQSVLERKLLLEKKLENNEKLLQEEINKNKVYFQKISNQIKDNLEHDSQIKQIQQQENDLKKVVDDLEQFQYVESQRDHDIQQINYISIKKLNKDKLQMGEILEKKQFCLDQEQIETQHILYNILQHVKKISQYKQQMKKIEKAKEIQIYEQKEVLQEFSKRQEEIKILYIFWQLKKLELFKQNINDNIINEEGRIADEKKRVKAKQLLIDLKMQIYEIKTNEYFELIQSTKLMKEQLKPFLQKIRQQKSIKQKQSFKKSSTIAFNFSMKFGNKKSNQKEQKFETIQENEASVSQQLSGSFNQSRFQKLKQSQQRKNEKSQFKQILDENNDNKSESSNQQTNQSEQDNSQNFKLDLYIQRKRLFDLFFESLFKETKSIQPQQIILIYNQSSIMLTSLQQEFKISEQEITKKTKEIPQLQKICEFFSNESDFINKNIKTLPLEKEMVFDNLEISNSSVKSKSEMNIEQFYYPVSIEGQHILLEEIFIRNNRLQKDTFKYQQIIESYFSSFKDFLLTFMQRINLIQQSVKSFMDVNKLYIDQFQETLNRYLAEKRIQLKDNKQQKQIQVSNKKQRQNKNMKKQSSFMLSQNTIKFKNIKKKGSQQFNLQKTEVLDTISDEDTLDGYQSTKKIANENVAQLIEKQILELPQQKQQLIDRFRYKLLQLFLDKLRQKDQHKLSLEQKLLHKDFITAFKYFQIDFKKYRNPNFQRSDFKKNESLIEESSGSLPKFQYVLEDFDPVFRKSDFRHVRQNAINILDVEKFQKNNVDSMASKLKLKIKLKLFQEKLNQQQQIQDIDKIEFLKDSKIEVQKLKQELKLKKEQDEAIIKKQDKKEIQKDKEEEFEIKKLTLKEQNQKIEQQIQNFMKKQKNNWLRNDLNKNKNNVLLVQRQEQFFIKDLKQKLSSRYQNLQNDFQKKYQNYNLSQNSKEQQEIKQTFRKSDRKLDYLNQLAQASTSKCSKQPENEQIIKINLSQEKRTQRLYTSLVQTQSNISEFKKKLNENQLPEKLQQGLKILSSRKLNKSEINNSFRRMLSSNGSEDEKKQIDLKQLSIVISKHFKESMKQRNLLSQQNEYQSNDFNEGSIIGSPFSYKQKTEFNLFDSFYDRNIKKPVTSSLKQRIQINKDLTKSVHLKPRKEETPLYSPNYNLIKYQSKFQNQLDDIKNDKPQITKNQIDDKIKKMITRKLTNNNLIISPSKTLTFNSDLPGVKEVKSVQNKDIVQKKKVQIFQNKSRNNQSAETSKLFTENQSYNLTYNTMKMAKHLKEKKRVQINFEDDYIYKQKDYSSLFKF